MRRFPRAAVVVGGLIACLSALAGTASASTWTNSGNTSFTATGTAYTITIGANSWGCTGSQMTGTAGSSAPGPTWSGAVSGSLSFTGCRLSGNPWHLYCPSAGLNAVSYDASADRALGVVGLSSGCLAGPGSVNGTNDLCAYTGSPSSTWQNGAGSVRSAWQWSASAGMRWSNNGSFTCPSMFGTGSASGSAMTLTVTAASGGSGTLGPILRSP